MLEWKLAMAGTQEDEVILEMVVIYREYGCPGRQHLSAYCLEKCSFSTSLAMAV
jgi:hypothetical protein